LTSVNFVDANNGWISGYSGTLLKTTNGGTTWEAQSGTSNLLTDVYFTDAFNGWAVGDNGTILHTTNGGLTFVEGERRDQVPTEFVLSQNFPNPFNPSTTIRFAMPEATHVTLRIYDVLGREVTTLVDGQLPAGEHAVGWNGINRYGNEVSSGVYLFKLEGGGVTLPVRKMVLMR
jgi:hypothetical protein